ncbi:xanthine dehydrogenase [Aedes aegypti]|uniref:Indole-3-acetaldehyde oxidase n=1 Tax=Aedes aegypti TaxID=7159 RepID=A0A1S4FQ39_AEDAE|nr:xanthine dehydrogenase [Aedes aegypti]
MEVVFTINGKLYKVNPHSVSVDTSLGTFIRKNAQLSGTKMVCREGGCGSCIVNLNGEHPVSRERQSWAVNSCLFPVYSCHGLDIVTVEGIGNKTQGFHDVQRRLAHFNGTQCGFCSPGMVMNMYSLLESKQGKVTMNEVENAFGGNLCRCTGYRPILEAFKSLAVDAEPRLKEACQDIEDLPKICSNTGKPCQGKCSAVPKKGLHFIFEDEKEWHKVYNIHDVFAIFEKIENRPYMLVAGNTAHGVYRRKSNLEVFIDVSSIEELKFHSLGSTLTLGANTTLSELMTILQDAANSNPEYLYCQELVKHVDLIANVPVRNTGTIAGNLSMKNQHNEFPSDLFLILEAVGAKITLAEAGGKILTVSPNEFCNIDMSKKILLSVVLPPLDPQIYDFRSYKIMARAQSVHAYVNAAFLFKFSPGRTSIQSASVCYGGINAKFTHAKNTESFLAGKNIFSTEILQSSINVLDTEITPSPEPSRASPSYRKHLALSLFYRAVLSIAEKHQFPINSRYGSGTEGFHRPLSSSKQEFQTIRENWPMTKNIPKIEGLSQTSGQAKYVEDLPTVPGELYAAFVSATHPRTKILNIDPSPALNILGVNAFFSAKDIPGRNDFMPTELENPEIEEIFCSEYVLYNGQPLGIILADSFDLAYQASKLVSVTYSEPDDKPILPTLKHVLTANASDRLYDQPYDREGEKFSEESTTSGTVKSIEGRFELPGQFHFSMEPQVCICVPTEDGMDVYSSTQWIDICQIAISQALNVPENSLNFYIRRLGGAFGSKISRASQVACACAIAAHFSQRPVRLVLSVESNMDSIGKRASCISNYRVEVDDNGKILKLVNNYVEDYGCSLNEPVEMVTAQFYKNCYDASRWKLVGKAALTNSASNTWCRGPGTNEGITMAENIMEHIAHSLGKDPLAVRIENMHEDCKIRELLPEFIRDVEYEKRKREIDEFNGANRWKKRGIAIVPMQYPQVFFGQMHALVSIYHIDGTVSITTGGIDMGQGVNTKVAQVASRVLGISMEKISIKGVSNLTSPNAIVSGGSMTSESACYAVKKACEILMERMKPLREKLLDKSWEQITQKCYNEKIDLCAMYQYKEGDIQNYLVWGLTCAEMEVDVLTGNVQIRRVDILEDTGESISPGIDIGQIEGAFVMGIGLYFTENLIYSGENGQLLTNRTWNYHLPGVKDIPVDFRVKLIHNTFNESFVLRSKTTGEPALNMTVALLFALRRALNSARKDAGLGDEWYTMVTPSTPEQICLAAGSKLEQFVLN